MSTTKKLRAWEPFDRSQKSPCLRIELHDKEFLVQYADFIKGTLNEAETQVSLYFHTLDVVIRGEKLRAVFREIQKFNVDCIRIGSGKEGDVVKIEKITVKEAPLDDKADATSGAQEANAGVKH